MASEYNLVLSSINLALSKIAQSLDELVDIGKQFNNIKSVEHTASVNASNDRITEAMIDVYRVALRHRVYAVGPCVIYDGTGIMIVIGVKYEHASDPFVPIIAPFIGRCDEDKTTEFIVSECNGVENPNQSGEYLVDEEVLIKAMIRNGFSFY